MACWGRKARPTAGTQHGRKVRVLVGVGVQRLAGLCKTLLKVLVFTE